MPCVDPQGVVGSVLASCSRSPFNTRRARTRTRLIVLGVLGMLGVCWTRWGYAGCAGGALVHGWMFTSFITLHVMLGTEAGRQRRWAPQQATALQLINRAERYILQPDKRPLPPTDPRVRVSDVSHWGTARTAANIGPPFRYTRRF